MVGSTWTRGRLYRRHPGAGTSRGGLCARAVGAEKYWGGTVGSGDQSRATFRPDQALVTGTRAEWKFNAAMPIVRSDGRS